MPKSNNSLYIDPFFQQIYDQNAAETVVKEDANLAAEGLTPLDAKMPYVLADGSYAELNADAAINASALGGRVASPEEQAKFQRIEELKKHYGDDPLSTAAAFSSGLVQDAIPGGAFLLKKALTTDFLGSKGLSEEEASNRLLALREAREGASFAGSAASAFIPNPLGKAAGALGHVGSAIAGKALGSGIAGKAGGWVAKQALEGGTYGANAAFNEDVLQNHPLQAERILHGSLVGGALQTALGIPFAAGKKALSKSFTKGAAPAAVRTADTLVPDAALDSLAKTHGIELPMSGEEFTGPLEKKAWYLKPGEKSKDWFAARSVSSPGATLEGNKLMAFDTTAAGEEARFTAAQAPELLEKNAKGMKTLWDKVETTVNEKIYKPMRGENRIGAFEPLVQDVPLTKLMSVADEALGHVQNLRDEGFTGKLSAEAKKVANTQAKELEALETKLNQRAAAGDKAGVAAVTDDVRKVLGRQERWLVDATAHAASGKGSLYGYEELKLLKDMTSDSYGRLMEMQRNPAMVGDKLAGAITDVYGNWSEGIAAKEHLARRGYLEKIEKSATDPFERITTMSPSQAQGLVNNYGTFVKEGDREALQAYMQKTLETAKMYEMHFGQNDPGVQQAVKDLSEYVTLMGHLDKQAETITLRKEQFKALGGQLGPFESLGRGAGTLFGSAIGTGLGSPVMGGTAGLLTGGLVGGMFNAGKRASTAIGLETGARLSAKLEKEAAKKFVQGKVTVPPNNITAKGYQKFAERLRAVASNPAMVQKAAGAAIEGLSVAAPKIAMEAMLKTNTAVSYLASTLPPQASTNMLQPQFEKPKPPSDMALTQLNRRVNAIVDPMSVYQNPTREGVEAIKAVYPALHTEMQNNVVEAISNATKPMDFNARQRYGLLFGVQTDQLSDPLRRQELQDALHKENGTQSATGGGAKPPKKTTLASNPLNTVQYSMTTKLEMGAGK